MRDIRRDLQERLADAEARRAFHTAELDIANSEVTAIMGLMDIEDRRMSNANDAAEDGGEKQPLKDFILHSIGAGKATKADLLLMAKARGYEIDGRNIHLTLVNLLHAGIVREGPSGRYSIQSAPN